MEFGYGMLLNKDATLNRNYFKEMCKLLGITAIYRAPKPYKDWTRYAEIDSNYEEPKLVQCMFEQNPSVKTMKKLGWDTEIENQVCIVSVPYDLEGIQVGTLFVIPDPLGKEGKLFRVSAMSVDVIYPSAISCELVPEFEDEFDESLLDHQHDSLKLLNEEDLHL